MQMILAFDGGATTTRAGLYDCTGTLLAEANGGAANPAAYDWSRCMSTLFALSRRLLDDRPEQLYDVAVGLAGVGRLPNRVEFAQALCERLYAQRLVLTEDLTPLLFANISKGEGMIVIAGTGSSVCAQTNAGEIHITGGRGALLGDDGGAYQVALSGLRAAAAAWDNVSPETALIHHFEDALSIPFEAIPAKLECADKATIAALAPIVTQCAENGDPVAVDCVRTQAGCLAALADATRCRLNLQDDTPVLLSGSLFASCMQYRGYFTEALKERWASACPTWVQREGHRAVAAMLLSSAPPVNATVCTGFEAREAHTIPPTERVSASIPPIDTLLPEAIVALMCEEDARASAAVTSAATDITRLTERAGDVIRTGGRIVYLGAGTSGRLGVLDASECPPTFGITPDRVIGLIAGGDFALRNSTEGAEDDTEQSRTELQQLNISSKDLVLGIAASGATPYVLSGLSFAKECGATTALISCNPLTHVDADIVVTLDTGPEVLAGSTRLKAGTATKMTLNMVSTGAMALAGYVHNGRMVHVRPVNKKLQRRAIRLVSDFTGLDMKTAGELLMNAGNSVAAAVLMAKKNIDKEQAHQLLETHGMNLRAALKHDTDELKSREKK